MTKVTVAFLTRSIPVSLLITMGACSGSSTDGKTDSSPAKTSESGGTITPPTGSPSASPPLSIPRNPVGSMGPGSGTPVGGGGTTGTGTPASLDGGAPAPTDGGSAAPASDGGGGRALNCPAGAIQEAEPNDDPATPQNLDVGYVCGTVTAGNADYFAVPTPVGESRSWGVRFSSPPVQPVNMPRSGEEPLRIQLRAPDANPITYVIRVCRGTQSSCTVE